MKVTKILFNLAEDYKFIGTIYLYLQIVFSVKIWSQVCYKALNILELTTANIFLPFICKPSFLLAFSFPFLPCIYNSGFPPPPKKKKKKNDVISCKTKHFSESSHFNQVHNCLPSLSPCHHHKRVI